MAQDADQLIIGDSAIAAVTEPPRRRLFGRKRRSDPLTHCENCGTPLAGPYCSNCGQHAIDYRRSFLRLFADVLDSFLNWDSKFFATLGLLIAKPWRLTNNFLAGKRVRYVHPLRLYLLISVAFFFGVHQLAKQIHLDTRPKSGRLTPAKRAKLERQLAKLPADQREAVRAAVQNALGAIPSPPQIPLPPDAAPAEPNPGAFAGARASAEPHIALASPPIPPLLDASDSDRGVHQLGPEIHFGDIDGNAPNWAKYLQARAKEKLGEHGVNVRNFVLTLVDNLPAMMLCCIPLFAFVLKILYIRRGVLYVDHLIYALHIHAFAYLAILLISFESIMLKHVTPVLAGWLMASLITTAVVLLLLSIRRVYRQGWFKTLLKFGVGAAIYYVVLVTAMITTFVVTLLLPD